METPLGAQVRYTYCEILVRVSQQVKDTTFNLRPLVDTHDFTSWNHVELAESLTANLNTEVKICTKYN